MGSELRRDGFDRLMNLFFVSHIGGEAVNMFRDRIGRRRQFEIDDRDLIDDLVFEQRIDDAEAETSRATGDDCVFGHINNPSTPLRSASGPLRGGFARFASRSNNRGLRLQGANRALAAAHAILVQWIFIIPRLRFAPPRGRCAAASPASRLVRTIAVYNFKARIARLLPATRSSFTGFS